MGNFREYPLAYHITFGTYGTRLHGDVRGTVTRDQNRFGEPVVGHDEIWQRLERSQLKFPPVVLSADQCREIENRIPGICEHGGWEYQISAGQPDHVYALLTTTSDGKRVRMWLKRWLGEALSERWPLETGRTWWAEGGSVKQVWEDDYFANVFEYIRLQRSTPFKPK